MIEFIDFVQQLFPSISPYTAEQTKSAISNIKKDKTKLEICTSYPFEFMAQGDIVSNLPFLYIDDNGNEQEMRAKAILLTNTCDAERETFIMFAPILPIETYLKDGLDETNIRKNKFTKLFYLDSAIIPDHVVDLNIINSISRVLVNNALTKGSLKKIATLNLMGYYLFLAKLTVHLMRPEDEGVNGERQTIGA